MDSKYFPKNYQDSRQKFVSQAQAVAKAAVIGQWKIPGTIDEDLFVDHVYLPPLEKSQKLFVITSGIHGSECYAGAAVQKMFMEEILPALDRRQVGIFIVHSMNPFGFKHHQRTTENKVNLNRNFSVSGEMYKFKNERSFALNEKFIPKKPVSSNRSYFLESMKMENDKAYFDGISLDQITKGISPGQFERPEHLEYGGKALEPQSQFFIKSLGVLMSEYQDIIGLDLHTGLGDRGRLHLLSGGGRERLNPDLFKETFDPQRDKEFYVFTPPETEGFYETYGGINAAFAELANKNQRVCPVTLEFGTLGHSLQDQIFAMNSFFLDHQGQFFGYENSKIQKEVIQTNFERSYPVNDEWKEAIIKAARGMFKGIFGLKI